MNERQNSTNQDDIVQGAGTDLATINSLIADLASDDGVLRVSARRSLVAMGRLAVDPLVKALADSNQWVRWEAAKALGQIGDPTATQALVSALEDKMFDVRWLAAEGLIAIGREALGPLLQALMEHSDSSWMREGVHHVFHDLARGSVEEILRPVLAALQDIEPSIEVPFVAKTALGKLTGKEE